MSVQNGKEVFILKLIYKLFYIIKFCSQFVNRNWLNLNNQIACEAF